MKKFTKFLTLICIISLIIACSSKTKPYLYFRGDTIETSFFAKPDASIETKQLKELVRKYPEHWKVAFKFLSELDTINLKPGKIILSDDVSATFSEYQTRDISKSVYESHKEFIDIQYVISGREQMVISNQIPSLKVVRNYDTKNDVANYAYDGSALHLVDKEHFFILFPNQAHIPNLKVVDRERVKKVVLKVRYQ